VTEPDARDRSIPEKTRILAHKLVALWPAATIVASALRHGLKTVFDQERPDRRTVRGHWRGIPFSGKRLDAFPSGHAVHIGALASAASVLPDRQRAVVWSAGAALVLTRIVLLAHWTSDVAVGLVIGTLVERMLRPITGYGCRSSQKPRSHAGAAGGSGNPKFDRTGPADQQPGPRFYSAATLLDF